MAISELPSSLVDGVTWAGMLDGVIGAVVGGLAVAGTAAFTIHKASEATVAERQHQVALARQERASRAAVDVIEGCASLAAAAQTRLRADILTTHYKLGARLRYLCTQVDQTADRPFILALEDLDAEMQKQASLTAWTRLEELAGLTVRHVTDWLRDPDAVRREALTGPDLLKRAQNEAQPSGKKP